MKKVQILALFAVSVLSGCATYRQNLYANSTAGRRQLYLSAHPDLPAESVKAISNGEIFTGMTSEQAKASWGEPADVNESVGSWGQHEQWVYKCYDLNAGDGRACRYLYFENGKLTSWQQ